MIRNIRLFQSPKADLRVKSPRLAIMCTLMRSNISELPEMVAFAKELGADSLKTTHLIPFEGLNMMKESLINCMAETNSILEQSRHVAEQIGLDFECVPNFTFNENETTKQVFTRPYCTRPFDFMYINSEGDVVPCVMLSMPKYDAGSFKDQTFDEIWNGRAYKEIRKQFNKKSLPEECRNCASGGSEYLKGYVFAEAKRADISNIRR